MCNVGVDVARMKLHAYTCEGAGDEECPGDADQLKLEIEDDLSKEACLHLSMQHEKGRWTSNLEWSWD